MPTSALPLTATGRRADFVAWSVAGANKRRRQQSRAEDGQVVSSYCDGTTLVEYVNYGGIEGVQIEETPDSPACPLP